MLKMRHKYNLVLDEVIMHFKTGGKLPSQKPGTDLQNIPGYLEIIAFSFTVP